MISGTSSINASTAITTSCSSDESGLSGGAVAGIVVVLSLLVVLPVGVVLGSGGMWRFMKSHSYAATTGIWKKRETSPAVYDVPEVTNVFSLTENQAYGQGVPQQSTS